MVFALLAIRALSLVEIAVSITTVLTAAKLAADTFEKVDDIIQKKKPKDE